MDDARLYKYHRSGLFYWLVRRYLIEIHRFIVTDSKLRYLFNFGPQCGVVTFLTAALLAIVILCSTVTLAGVKSDEKTFQELQEGLDKSVPRKKSIASIKPAYNCIHKHLQQTDVFQQKTRKMLRKEHLELEILNSRINCINKLLRAEERNAKKAA